jgi:hypothetical protein
MSAHVEKLAFGAEAKARPLTYRQRQVLQKAPSEWADLPSGIGCTNSTLEALERRNLVETRIEPGKESTFYGGWQWRLKQSA